MNYHRFGQVILVQQQILAQSVRANNSKNNNSYDNQISIQDFFFYIDSKFTKFWNRETKFLIGVHWNDQLN